MANKLDVYLHGMTLWSHIHLLQGPFPQADGYSEIAQSWDLPGGESANAAILLAGFGLKTRLDGPYLGTQTQAGLTKSLGKYGVDVSGMLLDPTYDGLEDRVMVGGNTRNVFGVFGHYFSDGKQRWSPADREALVAAKVVSLDPYFGQASLEAAAWCLEAKKPLVVIDCLPDSPLHQAASYTVLSREYLKQQFPGVEAAVLMARYTAASRACVIFTAGDQDIHFARAGQAIQACPTFKVTIKGTLGAGDAFRAGVIYGLHQGWQDAQVVRFAAATGALVCTRFPVAADPPGLDDVRGLVGQ